MQEGGSSSFGLDQRLRLEAPAPLRRFAAPPPVRGEESNAAPHLPSSGGGIINCQSQKKLLGPRLFFRNTNFLFVVTTSLLWCANLSLYIHLFFGLMKAFLFQKAKYCHQYFLCITHCLQHSIVWNHHCKNAPTDPNQDKVYLASSCCYVYF